MIRGTESSPGGGHLVGGPDSPRNGQSRRDRCPTCGARRRAQSTCCHRCQSDLSLLLAVESRADRLYRSALEAYREGCYRLAARRASYAFLQEAGPEFLRLWAVAALRAGDFPAAWKAGRMLLLGRNEPE